MTDLSEFEDATTIEELRRTIDRLGGQLAKEKHRTGELVEAVYRAAKDAMAGMRIPPVPSPKADRRRKDPETAILLLSDWQLGKKTPTYSSEVCEERIEALQERVERLIEFHRATRPVKKLALFLLGDLIEGELIFAGQAHHIDSSLFRQITVDGRRILSGLTRWAASRFQEVEVHAVPGNHGYLAGRARKEMHPESNGDRMLYEIVRGDTETLANVSWQVTLDWWKVADLGERCRFLLLHGDNVRGYNGIPWYGWTRKVLAWSSLSRIWPEMDFDHVAAGHFHTPVSLYINGRRLWINASTESHNPYALEQLAAAGEPAQWLLFCKPGRGVTAEYLVHL